MVLSAYVRCHRHRFPEQLETAEIQWLSQQGPIPGKEQIRTSVWTVGVGGEGVAVEQYSARHRVQLLNIDPTLLRFFITRQVQEVTPIGEKLWPGVRNLLLRRCLARSLFAAYRR